jgi:hypothetical protein
MTLTKIKALDIITHKKTFLKELEAKQKAFEKLGKEVFDQEFIRDLIEDAIIFESSKGPFPLIVDQVDKTEFEIVPVCNIDRFACYELDMADGMWAVYVATAKHDETEIARIVSQRDADRIAKEFVATGKKPRKLQSC